MTDDLYLARATIDADAHLKTNDAFYTEFPRLRWVGGLSCVNFCRGLGNCAACAW